jgi:hypothetical protein
MNWIEGYEACLRVMEDEKLEMRRGLNLDLMWAKVDSDATKRYEAILREQYRRKRVAAVGEK